MPCGGIFPFSGTSDERCFYCNKPGTDHECIEWDSVLHGRCIEAFLRTDVGQCVMNHGHEVIRGTEELYTNTLSGRVYNIEET